MNARVPASPARTARTGVGLALFSAATFGTSGSFATALITAGWSPGAAVTARISISALILAMPAALALRGRWRLLWRNTGTVGGYGLVAVAGAQLCYFNAVERLSVGVALLLEYLGTVLVVGWVWLRHGQRPRRLTVAGGTLALLGLVFVLDLTGHRHLDPLGVLWGLGAAVGLATYFVLSAHEGNELPPVPMAAAGMTVGALGLAGFAAAGWLPMHASTRPVYFGGHRTSWWVPVVGLSLVAAVIAYTAGIVAARRLGAKLASFLGLTEVLFAVLFAWLLLGQLPTGVQLAGGVLIVAGVALVRLDELRPAHAEPTPVP